MMIDFTNCPRNIFKAYGGANGNKINITYNDESYMLKFPPQAIGSTAMSYTNSCISEYISCQIYAALGIPVQETILGTYTNASGKENIVVACKDFTTESKRLMEFGELKNTCVDSLNSGYGTELAAIIEAIREQALVSAIELETFFWQMFIVDALLGNFDRHNGNWGLLVDEKGQYAEIAPVYDCGSCLYPKITLADMQTVLSDKTERERRIFTYPTSAIKHEEKKINYFEFISNHENSNCTQALLQIVERLDMNKINEIIELTPYIEDKQKTFYKTMILERKVKILDFSYHNIDV